MGIISCVCVCVCEKVTVREVYEFNTLRVKGKVCEWPLKFPEGEENATYEVLEAATVSFEQPWEPSNVCQ